MPERKRWVLDHETKGTGAQMVPLEKARQRAKPVTDPLWFPPPRRPREPAPEQPRAPRRFRVVDVVSGEPLIDDASTRATVERLRDVRSIVDVRVYVRDGERWRLLTRDEQRALWELRTRARPPAAEADPGAADAAPGRAPGA
jgi:hypothetical protein